MNSRIGFFGRWPLVMIYIGMGISQASIAGIETAVEAALQQHPEYRLAAGRQAVADRVAERSQSLLANAPAVALRHKSDQVGTDDGLREWEAALEMPLWLPGQRNSYQQLADGLSAEAAAERKLLAWEVAGEVRERAWNLRLAQSERDQTQLQLNSAKSLENEVQRRRQAGELADADWILARQESLSRQALLQEANAQVEKATRAWRSYTGLSDLPDRLAEQPAESEHFPRSHPRLLLSAGQVDKGRAMREQARIERRQNPLLSIGANRERGDSTTDYGNSLELIVTIPLGSSTHAAPRLASAESDLSEAEANRELTRIQLKREREQAQLEMQQSAAAIDLAKERKELTARGAHLAKRAFELGESDLAHLLRAANRAADSALELERKSLEYQRSIARYNQILGVMPK